ncbi:MAG: ABC transporter substrate-binding protein [Firmicutes bacterium]|nr:ABC transporter substrate-binding protein [Bacillota bacterium]
MRRLPWFLTVSLLVVLLLGGSAFAYNEAPMLAEKVKAGLLPPVEERLPENPLVIEPLEAIGKYGGTWVRWSTHREWAYTQMMMYGGSPIRWADDGLRIEPNWVERWESNEDATVWTFYLRKGVKWSDGHPLTTEDIMFWWEDMCNNPEMSDPIPDLFISGGQVAVFEALDDYTLRITYAAPAPLLPERLCMWPGGCGQGERLIVPAHYLKQFHPDYSDYEDFEVFEEKMEWWFNPECPVLTEWMPVEHEPARRLVLERNPYYYAVDTAGNQLPYIDRVEINYVEDLEVVKLKLLNGEADMQVRPYVALSDLAMLKRNEANGGYKVYLWDSGSGTGPIYYWNWNHPEPKKQELYRKPEFRRALSHAINRERIQRMLFFNLGEITTGTFSPKAIEFHRTEEGRELYKRWRDAYLEYNPEKAKELLDSIGVKDYDGDGWRDFPDGSSLFVRIDHDALINKTDQQTNEMVKADWEAIGIRTILNPVDSSALQMMDQTATFDIRDSWELGDGPNFLVFPQWIVPIDLSRWAPLYGSWYSVQGTPEAELELDLAPRDRTPPREEPVPGGPVDRLHKLYDQAKVEPDLEKREQLVFEMIKIHIEEGPFFIGTVADYPRVVIVNEKMRNVPDHDDLALGGFVNPWIMVYPAITHPATYFFDN